jgi:glycosyltransferase involved in cell wall biosynthesis
MSAVDVAVVVPTHRRPLRLRWLLEALGEQTVPFEAVVVHAAGDTETAAVLRDHPLAPRIVVTPDGTGPAEKRNAGWRASSAGLVVFTDDDCRPPAGWLAAVVAAAAREPEGIIQGATRVDPDELGIFLSAPHARSQEIDPPHVMAQTCNIAYPRRLLEAAGGFDESFVAVMGEDTDLYLRTGAALVPAPDAVTYHAVEWGLRKRVRGASRWQHMAGLVRKHPVLRESLPLGGYALDASHAAWLLAAAGLVGRKPLLAAPWLATAPRRYGFGPRGLARAALEAPGEFVADGAMTVAMLRGSWRYRTVLL